MGTNLKMKKPILLLLLINLSLSQSFLPAEVETNNKCTLECTLAAIGVYWACAGVCIYEQASNSCITAVCPLVVIAFDVPCLTLCNKSGLDEKEYIQFASEFV